MNPLFRGLKSCGKKNAGGVNVNQPDQSFHNRQSPDLEAQKLWKSMSSEWMSDLPDQPLHFTIIEPWGQEIGEMFSVRERCATDFEAPKLPKGRSGRIDVSSLKVEWNCEKISRIWESFFKQVFGSVHFCSTNVNLLGKQCYLQYSLKVYYESLTNSLIL